MPTMLPSVLWRCWLGGRKGIQPVKNMGDGGGGHWLVWMEWRPAEWSLCLPLLIFTCTIKSRSSLLAPAHPDGPGKRAVKRLWWWWWLGMPTMQGWYFLFCTYVMMMAGVYDSHLWTVSNCCVVFDHLCSFVIFYVFVIVFRSSCTLITWLVKISFTITE